MSNESIEETLRRSREVEERYKKFLKEKEESDKQWAITEAKIEKTLNKLSETKQTIKQIDELYDKYQQKFSQAIDSALHQLKNSKSIESSDPNFVERNGDPKKIADLLKTKKKVVFMTGAGVSAESGIPTFRDKDGYWTKKKQQNITPQCFLTLSHFSECPLEIWHWLDDFYSTKSKCKPNLGHKSIDIICNKMKSKKIEACIITQNIDNFHVESQTSLKSNSDEKYPIYEVHGNIEKVRCDKCSSESKQMVYYKYSEHRKEVIESKHPSCLKCASPLRPHIMFFDEFYQQKYNGSDSASEFAKNADLLVVIGTALQTSLARLTVQNFLSRNVDIIQINTECVLRHNNVIWMKGKSEQILGKIASFF